MNESAQVVTAVIIRVALGIAITVALHAVLVTFMWAWLAWALAFIASCFIENCAPMQAAKVFTFNATVRGVSRVTSLFSKAAA